MIFKSQGVYHYHKKWLIVDCDKEITRYYRHLIKSYSPSIKLQASLNKSHITIIAGTHEDASNHKLWKKFDNQIIEFDYDNNIKTNGIHYWLTVYCNNFEILRTELNLSPTIPFPWHLTIGNTKHL